MYRKVTNIKNTLRKEEIRSLERFKLKNADKDVKVYYVTMQCGCGFQYIATTSNPIVKDHVVSFDNSIDITDYEGRLEEFLKNIIDT